MRILITGASGFVGKNLLSYLSHIEENHEIFGLSHSQSIKNSKFCSFLICDLCCKEKITRIVSEIKPEIIIHLAGKNHGSLEELIHVNLIGTRNLLNAASNLSPSPRILIIGSSAEYGYAGTALINEKTPVNPISEYGISKVASSFLALQYYLTKKLPITVVKPFNLIGPGQSEEFVTARIIGQICNNDNPLPPPITLRRIDSRRDFLDIRDAVHAFWLVISHPDFHTKCAGQVFNLGSGRAYSIEDIVTILGCINNYHYDIQIISEDFPDLIPCQVCDYQAINNITGWNPSITLKKSLYDMINEKDRH